MSEMAGAIDEPLSHQTTPFQWTPSDPSVDDGADSKSMHRRDQAAPADGLSSRGSALQLPTELSPL